MFGSGNTGNIPQPAQKPAGLKESRLASNEQARPVPLVYGVARLGVTFLSQAFNQRQVPVYQGTKKDDVQSGWRYYADFACLVCGGPVDALIAVYFDQEKVWPPAGTDPITRSGNYTDITIEASGAVVRFYWGTENQDIDPTLATLSAGTVVAPNVAEEHPAYTGQCYAVFKGHCIGENRTSIQNIEFVVARYPSFGNTAGALQSDCNLAAVVGDALTNPWFGLGLDSARLDQAGFDAVGAELAIEGIGISPAIDRQQPFRQFLVNALEYVDGYHTTKDDGTITLGLIRQVKCSDESVVVIDETCLTDKPKITIPGFGQTQNLTYLTYTNRENDYQPDAAAGLDTANLTITQEPNPVTMQRPWVTRPDLADRLARIAAQQLAQPAITGTLRVRKSKLQGLAVGKPFKFNYAHYGLCWLYCRVTDVQEPDAFSPEVELTFALERGYLNASYYTPPTYTPPAVIAHDPASITNARVIELPFLKSRPGEPMIAFLVARPTAMTTAFIVNYYDGSGWPAFQTMSTFAKHGFLVSDYSADATGTVRVHLDTPVGEQPNASPKEKELPSITSLEGAANAWLLLIGDEIMSIWSPNLVSDGVYDVNVSRERFDTARAAHTAGDEVWVIRLADITGGGMIQWLKGSSAGQQARFKLQAIVLGKASDIAAAAELDLTFTDRSKRPWKARDLAVTGGATWNGTGNLALTWTRVNRWGDKDSDPFTGTVDETLRDLWRVDVHALGAPDTYPPDSTGAIAVAVPKTMRWNCNTAAGTLLPSDILAALGGVAQSFRLRLYAWIGRTSQGYYSRCMEELNVIKT